jgi:EmrB/QacA subfamily drug resistance transporter
MAQAGTRNGAILALTCLVQLMVVLDVAIVNVALPSIQRELGLGQGTLQWLVISYALMLGGFLLLGGRMADLIGRRRVLMSGLVLFSGASLVAGLGNSAELLIAARGVQGFGAALMAPTALSILAVTFADGVQRNRALGIFGAVGGTSASVGVIISGLLTDGPGWRWVFFINVPVGILLLGLAARLLAKQEPPSRSRRFDAAGATTVTAGLLVLVYALNRGADYGWASPSTLSLFAGATVLLALFVILEARAAEPLVPANLVRSRTVLVANSMAFFVFGSVFAFIFLGSLLMQQVLGYSATKTGVSWLATTLTAFVVAGVTGARLVNTIGVGKLLMTGMALLTISVGWLWRVPADASYATDLLPAFLLTGIAIGLCAVSVQIAALSGVAGRATGLASGLVETMREIGGAVGVAAVSAALISRTPDAGEVATPAALQSALLDRFHAAFLVIFVLAALGGLLATVAYARHDLTVSSPDAHTAAVLETGAAEVVVDLARLDSEPDRQITPSNGDRRPQRLPR